ncbi:hypothetical protein [Pseudomonas sp. GM_Psu_2]|uniref:hypothetical protein n=1 Tax=unclassified Pseudomonas TaxID=196821 RepID=UPI00226A7BFC|nr:hypothetical protein [Pseudomonas sp. GM_Psu_2]
MSSLSKNQNGVPQYPKGHSGRMLVVLASIAKLEHASAVTVAAYTGLSQGNIDTYALRLNEEFGTQILKENGRYRIESWGPVLKKKGVMQTLVTSEFVQDVG